MTVTIVMAFELIFMCCQLKRMNHGPLDFFIFDRTVPAT
jgi:hypothetical protein